MTAGHKNIVIPDKEAGNKRTLYLIDIENICGMPNPTVRAVKNARRMILAVMSPNSPHDIFAVGCDPVNAKSVKIGFPEKSKDGKKVRFGIAKPGKDGGDKALLFWIDQHLGDVKDWDRIVLCSGDGIFVEVCRELRNRGARFFLISRSRISSSQKLTDSVPKRFRFYLEDICAEAAFSAGAISESRLNTYLKKYLIDKWKKTNKQNPNSTAGWRRSSTRKSGESFGGRGR